MATKCSSIIPPASYTTSGGQISTKHQKTSIKPFFATCRLPQYPEFAKNLRSFDGFDQMSAFWSMFWFKPFRNFLRKIAIFRTFDHWSEILSLSAGRPISQGVCPPLVGADIISLNIHFMKHSQTPCLS